MRKGARRTVLYEVIGKAGPSGSALRVPEWGRRVVPSADLAAPPRSAPAQQESPPIASDSAEPAITIRADGSWVLALNTVGKIVCAAVLCALLLIAFGLGRRMAGTSPNPTITALAPAATPTAPTDKRPTGESDDELEKLMAPPQPSAAPAKAQPVSPPARESAAARPDRTDRAPRQADEPRGKPRYLRIESIKAVGAKAMANAMRDAENVQAFLKQNGVETVLQKVNNGVIILSAEGFPDGAASAADREAFLRRVKELGGLYRKQGGRYLFCRDCKFVN